MALFSEMMDEAGDLKREAARLRKGIQDYLDGNYRQRLAMKNDKCPHGLYGWEACENCIDVHFTKVLEAETV